MTEDELPEDVKEAIGHALIPLMIDLMKENGIEYKPVTFSDPIPLYDWMLKKPETDSITYNGQIEMV